MAGPPRQLTGRGATGAALALLPLLFLGVAFYWPLWDVLRLGLQVDGRWTGERLQAALSDPYVRRLILFTLEQAALSSLLSLGLGFPLGWFLTRYRFPGRGLLRAFTIVPFVLPSITVALGFVLFFGRSGHLNRLLMSLFGLGEPPIRVLYTLWAVVLAHAFYNAPVVARFVNAAWERADPTLVEAARALGARPLRAFATVTLPLLAPTVLSALALVFVLCTLSFSIPLALGGARYATVEVGVYLYARGVVASFPRAAALAILTLGLSLALTYLHLWGGGTFTARQRGVRPAPTVPLFSWERPGRALWLLYLLPAAVVFLGPIGAVIADSFLHPAPGGTSPTLHWYRMIISQAWNPFIESSPLAAVRTSLLVAGGATALSLVLGLSVSAVVRRVRSRVLETILMAPLAVSSVVLGLALLLAFRRPPLSALGGGWAIVLAHTLIVYPFVVRAIRPLWDGLDPALPEAARTLGATPFAAFRTVTLPLLGSGVLAAGAFAFALSLGEMTAVAMLSGPGVMTMPMAIYHFLGSRDFGAASAMATVLMVATALVAWAWDRAGSRWLHGERASPGSCSTLEGPELVTRDLAVRRLKAVADRLRRYREPIHSTTGVLRVAAGTEHPRAHA